MRIITGKWRSRRLVRPQTHETRPMPDRVREAIFSMLGARYDQPGKLPPLSVGDVFAGGGSMGLEALSRGALRCCFFERGRQAIEALRHNIAALDAESCSRVIARDAWRAATADTEGRPFELLFLDPPYKDAMNTSPEGAVHQYLARVAHDGCAPLVVFHHPESVSFSKASESPWRLVERRTFGTNAISFLEP